MCNAGKIHGHCHRMPSQQAAQLQSLHIPDAQLHFCSSFVDPLAMLIVSARGDDFNIISCVNVHNSTYYFYV